MQGAVPPVTPTGVEGLWPQPWKTGLGPDKYSQISLLETPRYGFITDMVLTCHHRISCSAIATTLAKCRCSYSETNVHGVTTSRLHHVLQQQVSTLPTLSCIYQLG